MTDMNELVFSFGVEKDVQQYGIDDRIEMYQSKKYLMKDVDGNIQKVYQGGERVESEYDSRGYDLGSKTILFSYDLENGTRHY